ncbi:uncharacterized protein C8Q71DRAFT_722889 [Rhodofomes roseus]|uniref:Uncharacterized protein n=1 Tax=Rhodofomes roseus TaxID=34475 RepID=A0ABQ8KI69_9APHY|nr:uncharacterized protein C8Q71DRAFT_722889 [Rhodofomes roseus]KAH9837535.1 hypothetical protein C8Q71DRAFT_722889 [Rhodofomes roseus]
MFHTFTVHDAGRPPPATGEDLGSTWLTIDLSKGTCVEPPQPLSGRIQVRHPLVRLRLAPADEPVAQVRVEDLPVLENRKNRTWIVAARPSRQLGPQSLVILSTSLESSGVGRLAAVTGFSRHWVCFRVQGSKEPCGLCVPLVWAKLGALERNFHATRYAELPRLPRPHPEFADNPLITNSDVSPYEFESDEEDEPEGEEVDSLAIASEKRGHINEDP